MKTKVSLQGITKSFGKTPVLSGIELNLAEGCFLSIVGPSGSGKTTLLRIIAGFLSPDRGKVFIDGKDVTMEPPRNRGIGMVFQHYALFPNLTVYENVAFGLRARKLPESETKRRVERMLALVHLEEKAQSYPRELSGGQQQRVFLARALVQKADVFCLDEPLTGVDAHAEQVILQVLNELRQQGAMILVSTHHWGEFLQQMNRVMLLNQRLIAVGTPQEVMTPELLQHAYAVNHHTFSPNQRKQPLWHC
jgi:ABC-type Fe3+/spermidine/putrescine transport system ATPase subunit